MDSKELLLFWETNKANIICYIRKKVQNSAARQDILHEVFIKFWQNHSSIKDKNKVLPWLLSVSRFTVADYFREKEKKGISTDPSINDACSKIEMDQDNVDESKKLLPIIHSLPPKYRNILLLSDIYGLRHKLISEQLNMSVSCIKQRVVRARKLLGQKMKECCEFTHDK